MARVEKNISPDGNEGLFINVSAVVGDNNAVNYHDDVLVVQALLKYLDERQRGIPDTACPEPTGCFSTQTGMIIREYQKLTRKRNKKKIVVDGRVSPAQGKFNFGRSEYMWTIRSLNTDAFTHDLLSGACRGYIRAICERWSAVEAALARGGDLIFELD